MIKTLMKYFLFFTIFIGSLLVFLPKENIYYSVLKNLEKQNIYVNSKTIKESYFALKLEDGAVVFNNIKTSNFDILNFRTYLFYTNIKVNKVIVDESFQQFLPTTINNINITHSILNPLFVDINFLVKDIKGFGVFDIINNTIKINIIPNNRFKSKYRNILKQMKEIKKGEFEIEYKL